MAIRRVDELELQGKRVFVWVDFNVPQDEKYHITDDTRILLSLPTIRFVNEAGGKVILASHLGRPKGKKDPKFSLAPIAERLSQLLEKKVTLATDCIGGDIQKQIGGMKEGEVILLENLRFHPEEEKNDQEMARQMASLADIYVNDAFGAAHRAHASTEGVARIVAKRGGQCAAGLLMELELKFLGDELDHPARPFVVILGGAKVSDKIKVIDRLLDKTSACRTG